MEKTAVEWLLDRIEDVDNTPEIWELIKIKAKEMEKQKLEQFYKQGQCDGSYIRETDAEQYYNQTFKK